MAKATVLLIEDDEDIQQLVSFNLIKAGFHVICSDTGEEGLRKLYEDPVDAVILDLMLPGINGLKLCHEIKSNREWDLPLLMLTAKGEESDVILGLESGADDYMTKPFSPKILIARLKALLRRTGEKSDSGTKRQEERLSLEGLVIHPGRHEATIHGRPMHLTMTEFSILHLLARKPGWVFTRQQIIDAVHGYDFLVTTRAVDVQIFGLRKKMGEDGSRIETVRGIGYRFRT